MPSGDAPNTPAQLVTEAVTPSQAAEASVAQVIAEQRADATRQYENSLDIRDPGRPAPPKPADEAQAATPGSPPPKTLPGATADGGLTPTLLARAARHGITEAEAKEFGPKLIAKALERLDAQPELYEPDEPQWQQPRKPNQSDEVFQGQRPFAFDPYTGQPVQPQRTQAPALPALDPEKYEPELVAAWEAQRQWATYQQQLFEQTQSQLQQVTQALTQRQQAEEQAQVKQQFRTLENLFAKDADYADVFGEGGAQTLRGTPFHQARAQVAQTMDALLASGAAQDVETAYRMAKVAVHGDRTAAKAQEKEAARTQEQLRNRAGQFVARPTATTRTNDLPPGPERAEAAVAALLRERNGGF